MVTFDKSARPEGCHTSRLSPWIYAVFCWSFLAAACSRAELPVGYVGDVQSPDGTTPIDGISTTDRPTPDTSFPCAEPGFAICDGLCVSTQSANNHCGRCNNVCPGATMCFDGVCRCPQGLPLCNGQCADLQSDPSNCGACGTRCPADQVCTMGRCIGDCNPPQIRCTIAGRSICVDTQNDATSCGMCGNVCPMGTVCSAGRCTCPNAGQSLCNNACVNLSTDPANCGACGNRCQAGQFCVNNACVMDCNPGTLCTVNGARVCVNTASDTSHCGGCNQVCAIPNAANFCAAGMCGFTGCQRGFGDCDANPRNGCEVNIASDAANCGGCGLVCRLANATASCNNSQCAVGVCNGGFGNCDGNAMNGCETNVQTDNANCGGCGMRCAGGQVCTAGRCTNLSIGGPNFAIISLQTNNCQAVEHNNVTGDDRGGIALSNQRVFYAGDATLGAFDRQTLMGSAAGPTRDSLVSDLRTQTAFVFGAGAAPIGIGGGVATQLIALDAVTGALTAQTVPLSAPITMTAQMGRPTTAFFSGYGRIVVLTNNHGYNIAMPSGTVTDLGVMPFPAVAAACESWAIWGTAEFFGNELYVDYVQDNTTISRLRLSNQTVAPLARFASLSDMCSFVAAPSLNRWYFHHEGNSQFRSGAGVDETIGYCPAQFTSDLLQINSLTTANCTTIEHNNVTGDDRNGIALTASSVLYTGDGNTGRFSANDLSGGVAVGAVYDGMFSDIAAQRAFAFTVAGVPARNDAGFVADGFVELSVNGMPMGAVTPLSRPITFARGTGIFSGNDRVVVAAAGRAFEVQISSGTVTDLGAFTPAMPVLCEGWAGFFGVAELIDGDTWLAFNQSAGTTRAIVRQNVRTGARQIVAAFSSANGALSDLCSFSVSPQRDRWYFHYEAAGFARNGDETLGFCDAAINRTASLRVTALFNAGCTTASNDPPTGDDRGGLIASDNRVFVTGDTSTGAFAVGDLTGGVSVGRILDSLVTDLGTNELYAFGDAFGSPITNAGGVATQLIALDSITATTLPTAIRLSQTIALNGAARANELGFYSGIHRAVVHVASTVYDIELPSGRVTIASMARPQPMRTPSETWATWGIAEYFGNELSLVYVQSANSIARIRVSDGLTGNVGAFGNLADTASIAFMPQLNRWYFHHEGPSQFRMAMPDEETVGFCNAGYSGAP